MYYNGIFNHFYFAGSTNFFPSTITDPKNNKNWRHFCLISSDTENFMSVQYRIVYPSNAQSYANTYKQFLQVTRACQFRFIYSWCLCVCVFSLNHVVTYTVHGGSKKLHGLGKLVVSINCMKSAKETFSASSTKYHQQNCSRYSVILFRGFSGFSRMEYSL